VSYPQPGSPVTFRDLDAFSSEVADALAAVVLALEAAIRDAVAVVTEATDIDFEQHPDPTQAQLMHAAAGSVADIALTSLRDAFKKRLEEARGDA
jgi:hypothetical protein